MGKALSDAEERLQTSTQDAHALTAGNIEKIQLFKIIESHEAAAKQWLLASVVCCFLTLVLLTVILWNIGDINELVIRLQTARSFLGGATPIDHGLLTNTLTIHAITVFAAKIILVSFCLEAVS